MSSADDAYPKDTSMAWSHIVRRQTAGKKGGEIVGSDPPLLLLLSLPGSGCLKVGKSKKKVGKVK